MSLTRKEFLSSVVSGVAGVAGAALLVGCGGEEGGADAAGRSCTMNGTTVDIGGNHGHVMTVSKADVVAGTLKTYNISGGAGHAHNVTLNANAFTSLQGNTMVTVNSTPEAGDGHTHSITIMCT
jgi:hypothetical protein